MGLKSDSAESAVSLRVGSIREPGDGNDGAHRTAGEMGQHIGGGEQVTTSPRLHRTHEFIFPFSPALKDPRQHRFAKSPYRHVAWGCYCQ